MEKDKALEEAEKLIRWIVRWEGEFKAKEAREWLEKFGTKKIKVITKLDK